MSVVAIAACAVGCRTRGRDLPRPETEAAPEAGGGDEGDGGGRPSTTGPRLMGYEYYVRLSYGPENGVYADKQSNTETSREQSLDGVKSRGTRYTLEHFPILSEGPPTSTYGYMVAEFRDMKPDAEFWESQRTALFLFGWVLPSRRIIAPVFGVQWEFNKIALGRDDTPEVSRTGVRALVLGLDLRQKVWGIGEWLGFFYGARLHALNPLGKSTGWEGEATLGTALQLGLLRPEVSIGYLMQRYKGIEELPEGRGTATVTGNYRSTFAQVSLWL